MDIVTHALIGTIAASPFLPEHPLEASFIAVGAALPDIDALSRVFGKLAFLRAHQTASHSLFGIAAVAGLCASAFGLSAGLALAAGMLLHTALDATNTYGIALLWPLRRQRYSLDWVFFIDGIVVLASLLACAALAPSLVAGGRPPREIAAAFAAFALAYWLLKAWLRRRALRSSPGSTRALLPSALVPWRFLGVSAAGPGVQTFTIDARSGRRSDEAEIEVLDGDHESVLRTLPEFRMMRELSPAYHVIRAQPTSTGTLLTCRDLRTRNLDTEFGRLDVELDPDGAIRSHRFHV